MHIYYCKIFCGDSAVIPSALQIDTFVAEVIGFGHFLGSLRDIYILEGMESHISNIFDICVWNFSGDGITHNHTLPSCLTAKPWMMQVMSHALAIGADDGDLPPATLEHFSMVAPLGGSWLGPGTYPPVISHRNGTSPFIVDFPMKNGDFPQLCESLPEGMDLDLRSETMGSGSWGSWHHGITEDVHSTPG